MIINSTIAYPGVLSVIENTLYGSADTSARLPEPQEIFDLFEDGAILKITDHGDGTWTAEGPDSAIQMLSATEFEITWPSAVYLSSDTYRISSL